MERLFVGHGLLSEGCTTSDMLTPSASLGGQVLNTSTAELVEGGSVADVV